MDPCALSAFRGNALALENPENACSAALCYPRQLKYRASDESGSMSRWNKNPRTEKWRILRFFRCFFPFVVAVKRKSKKNEVIETQMLWITIAKFVLGLEMIERRRFWKFFYKTTHRAIRVWIFIHLLEIWKKKKRKRKKYSFSKQNNFSFEFHFSNSNCKYPRSDED